MKAEKKTPLPLKTHGGKAYLAKWIISLMPKHLTYAEPFFGGGAVLLAKDPEGVSEIVNDLNSDLATFWHVLANPFLFYALERALQATPFSEDAFHFNKGYQIYGRSDVDVVRRAYAFFVTARQSLAGRNKDFATMTVNRLRRGMNEQVSAWLSAVDGLPLVHARMMRVAVHNTGAITFMQRIDNAKTLFYCDPPYLHSTRKTTKDYGMFEMTDAYHENLLDYLSSIKGKFILSGYDSELYRKAAKRYGWHVRKHHVPNNAAGGKKKRTMTECVWMNYEPPEVKQ